MQKNSLNKRFKLALAGSLFFGVGGAWGQGPVSSYALPQPRNPIAGNPAPIASSKNPSLGQQGSQEGTTGIESGAPRLLSGEHPPVISTKGNEAPGPFPQETIIQAQNSTPVGTGSSGFGFTLPKPFMSRNNGPSVSSPTSGASVLPGNGSPQILSAPGPSVNGSVNNSGPLGGSISGSATINGSATGRMPTLPAADGQINANAGINVSPNQPMSLAPGQGTIGGSGQIVYPSQSNSIGSRIWNWMNPNSAEAMGVTTLPVMVGADGNTIANGSSVSGPILTGPGMNGNLDGGMVIQEGTYMEGSDLWGMGGMPNMASGGRCNSKTKFFFSAELLLWFINGQDLPPLVTYGSPNSVAPGAMGQPGTVVAYGNGPENSALRPGGRFGAGWWFGERNAVGVDAEYLFLGEQNWTNVYQGFGNTQTVGRPFTNALTGTPSGEEVYQPGKLAGSVTVNSVNNFQGANVNVRWGLVRRPKYVLDLQTGGRWMRFDEDLNIYENLASTKNTTQAPAGSGFLVSDQFSTNNTFYGANFGLLNTIYIGRFNLGLNAKLGVGVNNQTVDIYGNTVTNSVTAITSSPGGLLAMPTNIGSYSQSKVTVIPELDFQVGYQLSQRWRFTLGYSLLYWSNVVRPGNIIDPVVNPNQFPPASTGPLVGPARPAFAWNTADLFIQGANLGLEFRY